MGIFTSSPEVIRPRSFGAFLDNIIYEGTQEVVVRGTFKETFVNILGKPTRVFIRFYRIGAQFEANSTTGLPILYNEDYETINRFESGYVTPNLDDAAARTFLTMEDRIGQLQSRIPGIRVNLIDGGKQVTRELLDELHKYAEARALDAYGKPVQLSLSFA